jgi:hypothetical protein
MPFCGHCKNLGKEYTSHFPRKTLSQNSQLTCPELLKIVCTSCPSRNHTFDRCTKKTIQTPVVQTPVKKSSTSKYNILLEEEKCPICQCIECYCDNNYLETKPIPRNYGEELYAIVAKDYPLCAGKMTGMFLELDRAEIEEMLETPTLMKERIDEASDLLDAKYPWGHVDAIFRPPCIHSRSSACEPNLEEVKKIDVREEYRARVYATNPFWDARTIDKIVEHFVMQALSPEEMYKLFVNFEEFKKQANLVVKKQPENYEDSYQYYCNYEEFSRSLTLNNASAADEEDEDDGYEEFSLSDRYENEDEYWSRIQEEKRSQIREDEDEEFQEWVIKSLEILKEM